MQFLIADSFARALGKLNAQEQSATKITIFDLQQNLAGSSLNFHRVAKSKDLNFWSIRVNRDVRVIAHKTSHSFLICYVDHHDDAYKWAERRRIEAHPTTGAAQIVEVRECVVEVALPSIGVAKSGQEKTLPSLFHSLSVDDLLNAGVPEDWIEDIRQASEDRFLEIANHIPSEAAEALLDYVSTGILQPFNDIADGTEPFDHPDAKRRFRVMENVDELARALEFPWDQWVLFLHPSQRAIVEREFNGPARVSGSAGTGKTVVALHRAAQLLKGDSKARVLLTTFSSPLANSLGHKLSILSGNESEIAARATVLPFNGVAKELFTLAFGYEPRLAKDETVREILHKVKTELEITEFSGRFLYSEWKHVVDAWQIENLVAYKNVPRLGRKNRMGIRQRETIWPVFEKVREILVQQDLLSWPMIFERVAGHFGDRDQKPFSHIVVDEAQDLGVPVLRLLAVIAPKGPNTWFFAGDLGQRIFQEPFSWLMLGMDVRGRCSRLNVNYRTSHQIRKAVDKLLPTSIRDVDGIEEERVATVSVFNGPNPKVLTHDNEESEIKTIGLWIEDAVNGGFEPDEIGVFVRSADEIRRAREAVRIAGQAVLELSDRVDEREGRVSIGTMHLAKGLEFKAVIVMACDDNVIPLQSRVEAVLDEAELDEVFDTERHLFYVACTRARDFLLISGVEPASEFIDDLNG